jgi:serine/threonine protein kinase
MTPERLAQIEELYHAARERAPDALGAFLAQACGDDQELRREVESLLAHDDISGPMMQPVLEIAADLLDESTVTHLTSGAQLGPYRIEGILGSGGMGAVYRAVDTRLDRKVAVKISAREFTGRFEREARAISALNHPNICTLYDVGPNYLVMELVEGETLASRLKKGALSIEMVSRYGAQIADALAAAHAQGIVHRDLKPGNIMITKAGVKVLDFGLAKIARSGNAAKESEPLTAENAVMGTLAYMAPEQAEGKECDARTDIFALGLILSEMATGKRLITGDSPAALIAAVMHFEPAPLENTPPQFAHVVECCLAREPERRWQAAADVRRELEWAAEKQPTKVTEKPRDRRIWAAGIALMTLLALSTLWLAVVHFRVKGPSSELARFAITLPDKVTFNTEFPLVVSPDGRRVVFGASDATGGHLWVRSLDSLDAQPLPGTERVDSDTLFWSTDSHFVAFVSGPKLMKIDVSGGPPDTICDLPGAVEGGSWNPDGVIIFATSDGIMRVSDAGGGASVVIRSDPSREIVRYPTFLPDGKHFIYLRTLTARGQSAGAVWVGSLEARAGQQLPRQLLLTNFSPRYAPSSGSRAGYILFLRENTLLAQAFNESRLELTGTPIPVVAPVATSAFGDRGDFSVSANGTLIYKAGGRLDRQLTWFNRDGKVLSTVGEPGYYLQLSLSPDGTRAAVNEMDVQTLNPHIWLVDLVRGTKTRFTTGPERDEEFPVWSPDGNYIVFRSSRYFYKRASNGTGSEELLLTLDEEAPGFPVHWSRDGRFLFFDRVDTKTGFDIWVLPLEGERKPVPFLRTEFSEVGGWDSPDGRWISYLSNETGRGEIYVQPRAKDSPAAGKWMVSKGGALGGWWPKGTELLYLAPDATVMKVDINTTPTFHAAVPTPLFQLPPALQQAPSTYALPNLVNVTADGNRFLVAMPINQTTRSEFNVVLNWNAGFKAAP